MTTDSLTDGRSSRFWRAVESSNSPVVVGTLGPYGTSASQAAESMLVDGAALGFAPRLSVSYFDSFGLLFDALQSRDIDAALVPSAARDATRFHWESGAELVHYFVARTPKYGLVAPSGGIDLTALGSVRVAALPETRGILGSLMADPSFLRRVTWVDAHSTVEAALIAARDDADLAVTNELGRSQAACPWLRVRNGVDILWMVFM